MANKIGCCEDVSNSLRTFTLCLLATTWALVTMSPSSDTTNPEPLATGTSRLENIILRRETKGLALTSDLKQHQVDMIN